MIVLEASLVVEMLLGGPLAASIRSDLLQRDETLIAPHLLDVEVVSALRNLVIGQRIDSMRSHEILDQLSALPAERFSHAPLLLRIWELRNNFNPYDATYIALAEATDSTLYTMDAKLTRGHRAKVVLFRTQKPN